MVNGDSEITERREEQGVDFKDIKKTMYQSIWTCTTEQMPQHTVTVCNLYNKHLLMSRSVHFKIYEPN